MAVNVYATLKQVLQDFIAPQLEALRGEISSLRSEIRRLDEKIDSVRNDLKANIARLDEKLLFTNKRLEVFSVPIVAAGAIFTIVLFILAYFIDAGG